MLLWYPGTYDAFYVTFINPYSGVYEDDTTTVYGFVMGEFCYNTQAGGSKWNKQFHVCRAGFNKHFRSNVLLRITEAFYNVKWILDKLPEEFDPEEYKVYRRFYHDIHRIRMYQPLPKFLVDTANELESRIK